MCTAFRNENAAKATDLIKDALAATRWYFGDPPDIGLVTFIDPTKVKPTMRRGKPTWGYTWTLCGFEFVGYTKQRKLLAFRCPKEKIPEAKKPLPPINQACGWLL